MTASSPFLEVPAAAWVAANRSAFALADAHPASEGHTLVIPRRFVTSWWDTTADERVDLWQLVDQVKFLLDARHSPDGYNVGFNAGAAAGQTVAHLHLHVIPRYAGDVPDPRGGIRWVIPAKGNYLAAPTTATPEALQLVDAVGERMLKFEVARYLLTKRYDRVDLLVSFIQPSGLRLVSDQLGRAVDRGAHVRVLTTDYLAITHPDALIQLTDLGRGPSTERRGQLELRVFHDPVTSFHPKAYVFWSSTDRSGTAFVGSNNLTGAGLGGGVEWALRTSDVAPLIDAFEALWFDQRSAEVDEDWLADYRRRFGERPAVPAGELVHAPGLEPPDEPVEPYVQPATPRPIQAEALAALEATRAAGHQAGLVVLATGLGKTWLAAFDANRPEFPRVLFIAHREEILRQARDVFRQVRPDAKLGFFTGDEKATNADVTFATIQTLRNHLAGFRPNSFDYVVVDEFHHAAAASYRKVIDHFEPRFLLGLTATPERFDGADLLALCGDNLVFRCDLVDGVERRELVPFHYWGVADTVDFEPIPWRNGRFDPDALDAAVLTTERADAAHREWLAHRGERTLAFCVSIKHAEYMAAHFQKLGVRAVALHSQSEVGLRHRAIEQLEQSELDVLFTVDLFNEGVDVPTLDTVLMLRATESPVVFLQQLGRGLRIAEGKSHLEVVDFVGNHHAFLSPLRTLIALRLGWAPTTSDLLKAVRDGDVPLPEGCTVDYSLEAVELLESLIRQRRAGAQDVLTDLCRSIAEEQGARPSALQVALAGGNVGAARQRSGGWFQLLDELELLVPQEQRVLARHAAFLQEVATTPMTKSFKMVLLRALIHDGRLRDGMPLDDLAARALLLIQADPRLAADVSTTEIPSVKVVESARWQRYWRRNPVDAWVGGGSFAIEADHLVPTFTVAPEDADAFDAMVAELVEWRLHTYFARGADAAASGSEANLRVSHSGGNPIMWLDRNRYPNLPTGDVTVLADGERYTARFVKIAVNVMTLGAERANALPALLRRWFGPAAGLPGTDHRVLLTEGPEGWALRPVAMRDEDGQSLPHFTTYAVACGAFGEPTPGDFAPRRQVVLGLPSVDADDFLVTVRGESMSGEPDPLHQGDLVRMRWARRASVDSLVGRRVLAQLADQRGQAPVLKLLVRDSGELKLRSTAPGYDDIPGSAAMTVVAEAVGKVDPAAWNPLERWVGQAFRRDAAVELFERDARTVNLTEGYVPVTDDATVFYVTLDKRVGQAGEDYVDRFEAPDLFHWTSQASMGPTGKRGRQVIESLDTGHRFHLFVRRRGPDLFTYCGLLAYLRHEGEKPMTVWWRLLTPLDQQLQRQFLG